MQCSGAKKQNIISIQVRQSLFMFTQHQFNSKATVGKENYSLLYICMFICICLAQIICSFQKCINIKFSRLSITSLTRPCIRRTTWGVQHPRKAGTLLRHIRIMTCHCIARANRFSIGIIHGPHRVAGNRNLLR